MDEHRCTSKIDNLINFMYKKIPFAQWGGVWGLFTLIAQAPTYFRIVHNWGIEMTGKLVV